MYHHEQNITRSMNIKDDLVALRRKWLMLLENGEKTIFGYKMTKDLFEFRFVKRKVKLASEALGYVAEEVSK